MPCKFPHYIQHDNMDCGAACLRMIAKYYGKNYSLETLREKNYITHEGISLLGISDAAEKMLKPWAFIAILRHCAKRRRPFMNVTDNTDLI